MNSSRNPEAPVFRGTTILAVRARGRAAMAGDGQVTLDSGSSPTVIKAGAKKVRRLYGGKVICGFAGSVGDAFTLFDKLNSHLEESSGDLMRAAVNLAKEWRTDRVLRQLQAVLLCMDAERILLVSGTGEVIEPDEPVLAIGSGGGYALAAARALLRHTDFDGPRIAKEALKLASEICIYTNDNIIVEEI